VDRRHLALAVAIGATLADERFDDPLVWGEESRNGALFTLGPNHPVRMWQITYSADLPGVAGAEPYGGAVGVYVEFTSDRADDQIVRSALVDCETDEVLIEDSVTDERAALQLSDAFPSCIHAGFCEQSYCLVVQAPEEAEAADLIWYTDVTIGTDAYAEEGEDGTVVDILIEYTEIDP
jgi:hypothetical protein